MQASAASVLDGWSPLKAHRVHVVGLGGTGIRGLVPMFLARGMTVTGSDVYESPVLEKFRDDGVVCWVGHSDRNVDPGTDLVLISAAVEMDNPEVRAAAEKRITVLKYAQCLGYLMGEKQGIAVAGTHGKTTTTTMVAHSLVEAGLDPSFLIGGEYPSFGGSSRSGRGPHFVAEACEFDRSFLNLRPKAAVVTNIEEEHLDYFSSLAEIQQAFGEFIGLLPPGGCLVHNADDRNSAFLRGASAARMETFSLLPRGGDWWAEDVVLEGRGSSFRLHGPEGKTARVRLAVPGLHNVRNALACAAVCSWAGVPLERIARSLGSFSGVRRRFDVLLEEPVAVIDDYAHHPTEVETVIRSARQAYPGRRLLCVFQPHQYSRLRHMLHRFAEVLSGADEVLVTGVYRSRDREDDVRSVHSGDLVEALRALGSESFHTPSFEDALLHLGRSVAPGCVVVFLGAGTITELAKRFALRTAAVAAVAAEAAPGLAARPVAG
jgi:UDP-N-acetylmuramate--alanine ligase